MKTKEPKLVIGGIYRHFKGELYRVDNLVIDSEEKKEYVLYTSLYHPKAGLGFHTQFIRLKDMFLSPVDRVKYPDVEQYWRFQMVYDWEGKKVG
ncbi:hypothetical protein AGMMS50249_1410 [candidate division SR1 bacterium]|nr:hypothetical protein AGMMS50249_1410 [candidate division SR1 bacterium]